MVAVRTHHRITVLPVGLALATFCSALVLEEVCGEDVKTAIPARSTSSRFADWMYDTRQTIGDIPLHRLAIPATHDMGMFEARSTYSLAANLADPTNDASLFPPDAKPAMRALSFLGPAFRTWCVTQERDAYAQLVDGIRYFDLRICVDGSNDLATCHGLYGAGLDAILEDIERFCTEHPHEVVILGLNHLWDRRLQQERGVAPGRSEGLLPEAWTRLFQLIEDRLGARLVPPAIEGRGFDPTSTLNDLWKQPPGTHQIICNIDRAPPIKREWLWVGQERGTWVGSVQDRKIFKARTQRKILEAKSHRQFWSVKTCITPDAEFIARALMPGSTYPIGLRQLAEASTPVVLDWVRADWKDLPINLVWADFYNRSELVTVCLERNGVLTKENDERSATKTTWGRWQIFPP